MILGKDTLYKIQASGFIFFLKCIQKFYYILDETNDDNHHPELQGHIKGCQNVFKLKT